MRTRAGRHWPRLGSALLHPWWGEAWLQVRHARTALLAGVCAMAVCTLALAGMHALHDPALQRHAATALNAGAAHSGLVAVLAGLAAWRSAHRAAQARVDRLTHGWWRAAPVRPVAVDGVVAAHALAVAATVGAAMVIVAAVLAGFAQRAVPWAALQVPAVAVMAGVCLAGGHVAWRHRHPAVAPRAGVRAPLWRPPVPRSRTAPHLFDWQRREGVLRWRNGGSMWVVGACVALSPSSTPLPQFLGVLLMAGCSAWLSTALQASGDVARAARTVLRATPISRLGLWRASGSYPLFAVACAGAGMALAVAVAGPHLLVPCAVLIVVLSAPGLWRLWRAGQPT